MVDVKGHDEFGFILWYHAPKAYYHYVNNELNSTDSKIGTQPVFYFSENHQEHKLHTLPFSEYKTCYNHSAPKFTNTEWLAPPYKSIYKNDVYRFNKPILTINNKNSLEWGNSGIYNYFNAQSLRKIYEGFQDSHQIIYIRPPNDGESCSFQRDTNQEQNNIGDIELLTEFPEVLWIGDLLKNSDKSYNELQFMLLANSDKHISCAGDAVISSYFGGDVLIYNCPNCNSSNRGVWKTDSWLGKLSEAKIHGFNNYHKLIDKAVELWK